MSPHDAHRVAAFERNALRPLLAELGPKVHCCGSPPANAPLRLPPSTTRLPWIFLLVTHGRVAAPEVHHGLLDVKGVVGKPGMIELMLNPLLSDWYEICSDTRGKALPWGRFRVDPAPAQTLRQLRRFLTRCPN
jgi:hypothetical protein